MEREKNELLASLKEREVAKAEQLIKLQQTALSLLRKYIDSEELPPNQGFHNKELERAMVDVGWAPGMEWCSLFAEMIWKKTYESVYGQYPEEFDKLFSANSQQTYKNFIKKGWTCTIDQPTPGCLVIWRKNEAGSKSGHVDLCEVTDTVDPRSKLPVRMKTIGGNVSDGVRQKTKFSDKHGSYVIMGFVHLEAL